GGVEPVPEREADARPGARDLGNAVLPRALRRAAGDQQVAALESERRGRAPAARPQQQAARGAERQQRDDRRFDLAANAIAVPGDAVPAVAVEVEPDRVEDRPVALGQRAAQRVEDRGFERLPGRERPERRQAWFEHLAVVDAPRTLRPAAGL